jgi:hypothetical protein
MSGHVPALMVITQWDWFGYKCYVYRFFRGKMLFPLATIFLCSFLGSNRDRFLKGSNRDTGATATTLQQSNRLF